MSIIGLVLGIIEHSIIGTLKSIMCVSLDSLHLILLSVGDLSI